MTAGYACGGDLDAETHPLAPVASTVVTAGTLAVAFGLLALDFEYFWVAFVVGFGGVLPVSLGLLQYRRQSGRERPGSTVAADDRRRPVDAGPSGDDGALAELRQRYARGDISDAEFERRVERLLETEDGPLGPE